MIVGYVWEYTPMETTAIVLYCALVIVAIIGVVVFYLESCR